jgi:hypothetical protein
MKYTLDQLKALTDEELTVKVAVEIMGFTQAERNKYDTIRFKKAGKHGCPSVWEPLENWNHTMDLLAVFDGWSIELSKYAHKPFHIEITKFRKPEAYVQRFTTKPQRGICIAALLTLPK